MNNAHYHPTVFISGLEVFFPYDFIYKEQLSFMLELKASDVEAISARGFLKASAFLHRELWMPKVMASLKCLQVQVKL